MSQLCHYSVTTLSLSNILVLCYAICAKGKGGHQNRMRVIHEKGDLIMASFTGKVVGGNEARHFITFLDSIKTK